jgi:hypothetical protein
VRDLWAERRDIYAIFRGEGQINMVPGLWEPQLVGVDVLVYKREGRPLSLSVVWQDEGAQLRHAIDFSRFSELVRRSRGAWELLSSCWLCCAERDESYFLCDSLPRPRALRALG